MDDEAKCRSIQMGSRGHPSWAFCRKIQIGPKADEPLSSHAAAHGLIGTSNERTDARARAARHTALRRRGIRIPLFSSPLSHATAEPV
jgi:hypothetical protein